MGDAYFKFRSGKPKYCDRWHGHAMTLPYFTAIKNCMRHEVNRSAENQLVWTDDDEGTFKSFLGINIYSVTRQRKL